MPTGISISDIEKQRVINYYLSRPMTISECSIDVGLCVPTIIKILDEYQIERHSRPKINNPNLNEHYFENIDSEEKAYYLGFIITDGNVFIPNDGSNRQAHISITQSEDDKYILEIFANEINSYNTITYDGRGASNVSVNSNIMASDLKKYGIIPNKTCFTKLPQLEDLFMPHLIRGILDGDGSIISIQLKSGKHKHAISFCGSNMLMNNITEYLSNKLNVIKPKIYSYSDKNLSEVKWQSINDVLKMGNWIYYNAHIYLKRKYNTFLDFKIHYQL